MTVWDNARAGQLGGGRWVRTGGWTRYVGRRTSAPTTNTSWTISATPRTTRMARPGSLRASAAPPAPPSTEVKLPPSAPPVERARKLGAIRRWRERSACAFLRAFPVCQQPSHHLASLQVVWAVETRIFQLSRPALWTSERQKLRVRPSV